MDRLTKLRNRHAMLVTDLLVVFRKHEFLSVERWADPEGVADLVAADLMVEVATLLDDCWYPEPATKRLAVGDIFAIRSEQEKWMILGLSGNKAYILDLLDFRTSNVHITPEREYVVWGHIE